VPKFDLILKPGEPLPEEFVPILTKRLSPVLREKLLKHGGLIRLSVSSPYVDRKEAKKHPTQIDDIFMAELEARSKESDVIRSRLELLSIKQLMEIIARLGLPVRSKASSREIREAILQRLQSGHFWEKISHPGNLPQDNSPKT
jgi:hypothetical protein